MLKHILLIPKSKSELLPFLGNLYAYTKMRDHYQLISTN